MALSQSNTGIFFTIGADSAPARDEFKRLASDSQAAARSIQNDLANAFRASAREGEGAYTTVNQVRIGLTQLGRGDLGGIPNLIRAYRIFISSNDDAKKAVKLLDAALLANGVTATKSGHLVEEFGANIKKARPDRARKRRH
ncbi:MAG TPA: hypothetical protein VFD58_06710 [Blastocatellia bacterium]|nr:hypothetical protein [Blastocatellia bacterium]